MEREEKSGNWRKSRSWNLSAYTERWQREANPAEHREGQILGIIRSMRLNKRGDAHLYTT